MNEQNTKMMEAAQRLIEARDADTRADERRKYEADIGPDLQIIYAALERINNRVFGTLAAPPAKRKRAKTGASDKQVEAVRSFLNMTREGAALPVKDIAKATALGPRIIADACKQLQAEGWIRETDQGWQWIPEAEAERENGLQTEAEDGIDI